MEPHPESDQTPGNMTQQQTTPAPSRPVDDAIWADLREKAKRTKRASPDGHAGVAIAEVLAESITPKREPPAASPVPPAARLLRDAARIKSLEVWERFDRVADQSIGALAHQLDLRYSPTAASLEAFQVYDPKGEQAAALNRVREFIADMEEVLRDGRGLVLYGPVGTGKDHLVAAVLYHVAKAGIPAAWVSGEEIFLKIRDSMDTGELEDKIIRRWEQPTVLGISDPVSPHGELKEWDARILARLIDRRYRKKKPTFLTMNAISEADAREKLTNMIWDRLQDGSEVIPCFWQSYRSLKAKPAIKITRAG